MQIRAVKTKHIPATIFKVIQFVVGRGEWQQLTDILMSRRLVNYLLVYVNSNLFKNE